MHVNAHKVRSIGFDLYSQLITDEDKSDISVLGGWTLDHLQDRWTAKLGLLGYDLNDLAHWAWILEGRDPDDVALRLVSTTEELPMFLVFMALRGEIQKVRTLKSLLVYVWDCMMGMARPDLQTPNPIEGTPTNRTENRHIFKKHSLDQGAFNLLISTLLNHTRRLWPAAMHTVANLIPPYILSTAVSPQDQKPPNPKKHAKASVANNRFIRVFALPASLNPLKSMSYNWAAQRVLLQLAGQFQPPLTLDKPSYEAVIQVLTALKKTHKESRVASLRARSWPPWRIDQDGMDADRSPEDDQSRAIQAILRSKEAGYGANLYDQTMSIFAGQEVDGTPTIHTRKQVKARSAHRQSSSTPNELDPLLWAARIESTRDAGEAWSAFVAYQEKGGKPTQNVYLPMFQKIEAESRRLGRVSPSVPLPGDGREVLPVSDDNFSEFYKKRFQPPTLHRLYQQMINSGFLPKGRTLNFLVRHARTLDEGLEYLQDGGFDNSTMRLLCADPSSEIPLGALDHIPLPLFASIIHLFCRFVPHAIAVDELDLTQKDLEHEAEINTDAHGKQWVVRRTGSQYAGNPLSQAAFLLAQRKPAYRPAWYALFKGLASRNLLISQNWEDAPNNDRASWNVVMAALNELHGCGLELDPYGFILICRTFEKYAVDYFGDQSERPAGIQDASQIVKAEFAKLIELVDAADILPLFMHQIHGAHLHAYIRCMGLVDDHAEILSVLRWMVKYHEELDKVAVKSQNGWRLIRHALIAARTFVAGTGLEAEAEELVESVESWGGWPIEEEEDMYNATDLGGSRNQDDESNSDSEQMSS